MFVWWSHVSCVSYVIEKIFNKIDVVYEIEPSVMCSIFYWSFISRRVQVYTNSWRSQKKGKALILEHVKYSWKFPGKIKIFYAVR